MSIDRTARTSRTRARGRSARGFTFLEMVITTAIIGLTTLVIERTISGVTETERSMRSIRNTSERCQRAAYRLRDIVAGARKLFQNDAAGVGYLAKLDLPAVAPLLAGSRLPKFDETKSLGPDLVGDPRSGNILLFVRECDPLPCIANAATKKVRSVDTYRFVCVYLTTSTRTLVSGGPQALDLAEWRSTNFPSYAQVMAITDTTERAKVVADLYNRFDVDYLWDLTKDVATAFYGIDGVGTVNASPSVIAKVPEDRNVSARGRFVSGNMAVARTDTTSFVRKPMFSADDPAVWSPQGFEVKIASPSGARRVWIRLTVEQQASKGRVPAYEAMVVANTRDV
jgi:prepilin-type N-terminal cleavage/methylation domain-containing protein